MADWHGVYNSPSTGPCDMYGYSDCSDPTGTTCPSVLYDIVGNAATDGEACRDAEHMARTHTIP